MPILAVVIQVEAWAFLVAVTGIVLHRLVSGGVNIGEAQLNRAQLLLSVIGVAAYYLSATVASPEARRLPFVPDAVIATLGGSNLIYLANKLAQLWPMIAQTNKNA